MKATCDEWINLRDLLITYNHSLYYCFTKEEKDSGGCCCNDLGIDQDKVESLQDRIYGLVDLITENISNDSVGEKLKSVEVELEVDSFLIEMITKKDILKLLVLIRSIDDNEKNNTVDNDKEDNK